MQAVQRTCDAKIEAAVQFALDSPYPDPEALFENVYV
jgi:TPP-dependent pyruvate/acetoin dehydrogenase alpha subunit